MIRILLYSSKDEHDRYVSEIVSWLKQYLMEHGYEYETHYDGKHIHYIKAVKR